jgi:hypothetical protein
MNKTKHLPLKGFKIELHGKTIVFHDFIGSQVLSKRIWYKPWKRIWFVKVELFDLFSLPTTFSSGSIYLNTYGVQTKEEANKKQIEVVQIFKRMCS